MWRWARTAGAAALLLAVLPAQQRVRLQHDGGDSALARQTAALLLPEQRVAAMQRLWQAGQPSVQMLLAIAGRGDDAAAAALQVLAAFGGEARSALPQLQRLAAAGGRLQADLDLAIAAIGERDSVIATIWGVAVVEFDADGKELRRVPCPLVWGARPLPHDRLLVTTLAGTVTEIDWQGNVHWSITGQQQPCDARRLVDGSTVVACWSGYVARFDAAGKELWRRANVRAVDVEPLWNGHFLVAGHEDKQLLEIDGNGGIVWQRKLPDPPMDVDVLPGGNLLVAYDAARRLDECSPDGKVLRQQQPPADPEDVQRLGDGRTVIADTVGVAMLAADGKVLWRVACGHAGHVVARLAGAAAK